MSGGSVFQTIGAAMEKLLII